MQIVLMGIVHMKELGTRARETMRVVTVNRRWTTRGVPESSFNAESSLKMATMLAAQATMTIVSTSIALWSCNRAMR